MNINLTEIAFILDRSGSMKSVTEAVALDTTRYVPPRLKTTSVPNDFR